MIELFVKIVILAIKHSKKEEEVMVALEQSFGPIELTKHILLSLLCTRDLASLFEQKPLQERIKLEHIIEKVLIAAIELDFEKAFQEITQKSNHVSITLNVVKVAIRSKIFGCFRFF